MKKLIMAVAIVCAAVGAQAAQVAWSITSASDPVSGDELGDVEGFYAFILVDSVTAGSTTTYSRSDALTALGKGDASFLSNAVSSGEIYYGAGDVIDGLALDNTVNAYAVIIDAATVGDATKAYITDNATVTLNGVGPEGAFEFGMLSGTADSSNWATLGDSGDSGDVPEPTSGLLMLLGVAGLALRRRRA